MTTSAEVTASERENYEATIAALDRRVWRLRDALASVLDAHHECNDGSGMICAACAIAMSELSRNPTPKETPHVR